MRTLRTLAIPLATVMAATALTACSTQSAAEYVSEENEKAAAQMSGQLSTALSDFEATVEHAQAACEKTRPTLEKALQEGDLDTLKTLIGKEMTREIDDFPFADQWVGDPTFTVTCKKRGIEMDTTLPDFDPVDVGDRSRKDIFGDTQYIPTIDGEPYTSWQPDTELATSPLLTVVSEAEEAQLDTSVEGDSVIVTSGLMQESLVSQSARDLLDYVLRDSRIPALIGKYEIGGAQSVDGDLAPFFSGSAPVYLEEDASAQPTQEVFDYARNHVEQAVKAQEAMGNDDPNCDYAFARGRIQVNGASTPVLWACETWQDMTMDHVDILDLEQVELDSYAPAEASNIPATISLVIYKRSGEPVLQVAKYTDKGAPADPLKVTKLGVTLEVVDGKLVPAAKNSITVEGW